MWNWTGLVTHQCRSRWQPCGSPGDTCRCRRTLPVCCDTPGHDVDMSVCSPCTRQYLQTSQGFTKHTRNNNNNNCNTSIAPISLSSEAQQTNNNGNFYSTCICHVVALMALLHHCVHHTHIKHHAKIILLMLIKRHFLFKKYNYHSL